MPLVLAHQPPPQRQQTQQPPPQRQQTQQLPPQRQQTQQLPPQRQSLGIPGVVRRVILLRPLINALVTDRDYI